MAKSLAYFLFLLKKKKQLNIAFFFTTAVKLFKQTNISAFLCKHKTHINYEIQKPIWYIFLYIHGQRWRKLSYIWGKNIPKSTLPVPKWLLLLKYIIPKSTILVP